MPPRLWRCLVVVGLRYALGGSPGGAGTMLVFWLLVTAIVLVVPAPGRRERG
ncbi:hypothetical protein AB0M83_28005 [Amycolatopsis sp. NPDC051106]|uniref:hypothetical protein n=1 Tax=unclassified Amycolatopsis TaxID=2618356 RepID=UPI00342B1FD1